MKDPAASLRQPELDQILARVDRLESESEIRRLMASYQRVNDAGSASGVMPAWGDLDVPAGDGTAREQLDTLRSEHGCTWTGVGLSPEGWPHHDGVAVDQGVPRPDYMPRMMHFLTNERIEVHDDHTATGSWYCWEPAVVQIDGAPTPILIVGRADQRFVREHGRWLLAHVDFEEVFSTTFNGPGWVAQPHVAYGPAQADVDRPRETR
ncbi:nuclear transport factor 2 family protein [Micromonospora olivasterospora]|uniref:SnoaL-like protein n=1 Tax=Micromonospora olivasterospora TaxID=1880 RepID=A0A562IJT5_MICOL|nr:nuclear transport factor 2 family protein [Micromonospora olivasterospora]TWH71086.1 SnoaL-like protein [Micromonospora olivasterospora]